VLVTRSAPWPPVETELPPRHPEAPAPGTELGPHYAKCFGCGEQPDGLHMRMVAGDGLYLDSTFTVLEAHQGAPGLAHGGLLVCAFDEALGTTAGTLLRRPAVTGKLETDFLRPVPVDSVLHIRSTLDGVAGRKVYVSADGRLGGPDGPVAVKARGLFVTVKLEHFAKHGRASDIEAVAANPSMLKVNP
jgi:acyl-coenzyme A thioesterase PaaI-like protein